MCQKLEQKFAYHCGPALAGIKPANLISLNWAEFPDLEYSLQHLNQTMNKKDIYFNEICRLEKRTLILVFRKKKLIEHISEMESARILENCGYPAAYAPLNDFFTHLGRRICEKAEFPHEIGVFLGYPPADIKGFMEHKGKNFKLSGYWKVYGDAILAQSLFDRYKKCSRNIFTRVAQGSSLAQIFCV